MHLYLVVNKIHMFLLHNSKPRSLSYLNVDAPPTSFMFTSCLLLTSCVSHLAMTAPLAFLDGQRVPVLFDARLPISYCPPPWIHDSPSHVSCQYDNGFTFASILRLSASPEIGCLVLGHDWINAERVARRSLFYLFALFGF